MESKGFSVYNETIEELPWNMLDSYNMDRRMNQIIMRRIAINLAEVADQLAEMNRYVIAKRIDKEVE